MPTVIAKIKKMEIYGGREGGRGREREREKDDIMEGTHVTFVRSTTRARERNGEREREREREIDR